MSAWRGRPGFGSSIGASPASLAAFHCVGIISRGSTGAELGAGRTSEGGATGEAPSEPEQLRTRARHNTVKLVSATMVDNGGHTGGKQMGE